MTPTTMIEGNWEYRKPVWYGTFVATDRRTGEAHETGADDIAGARAFAAAFDGCQDEPASTCSYTVASGPQRARAGHQRRRAADFQ